MKVISEDEAKRAVGVLVELLDAEDHKGVLVRERAASSLVRLFQSQQRRAEQEAGERSGASQPSPPLRDLSAMSKAELTALREEMTKDFPGKGKPS